jgi:hypothetical protein
MNMKNPHTYKIGYRDAAGVEAVQVQFLAGGGKIVTLGEIESTQCLGVSWACKSGEARGAIEGMPEWLAKIYLPELVVYPAYGCESTPEEIERVRSIAVQIIRLAMALHPQFAVVVAENRARAVAAMEDDRQRRRLSAAHPQTVQMIRRQLGRRRIVDKETARGILRAVAPDEDRVEEILTSLRQDDSITLWSPDCGGHMRYDEPGTMSHRPSIVFAPKSRSLSLPTFAPNAIVLRIAA